MRKDVVLPSLALAGGVAGFLLRRWQLASAYVPETGLFTPGAPATYALLGLTALLGLAFLLLLREKKEGLDGFLPAFGSPDVGQMTVLAAAGLLMMAAGLIGLFNGLRDIQLWQLDPEEYQLSALAAKLLAAALCLPAGNGVLLMGRAAYRGELDNLACRLTPFPALAGLVWVFSAQLNYSTEPVLMKYAFSLFAALLLTLAHYYFAGFLYGKPRPRLAVLCALMGIVVGITSLAGGPDLFTAAATAAFSLSALGFSRALLGGPWPERMPPAGEDEQPENASNTDI